MSVRIYRYSLCNNPEAPSSHKRRKFSVVGGRGADALRPFFTFDMLCQNDTSI